MLPFLFTTLKRRLGTEDTKWWSVSGVILSHSSCKQVLRWATVRGLRCRILRFKMHHTFSIGDRSGLQAGQSSTPHPLPPQPGLCNVCRMWFCIVLLKYAWTSLEKMSSWRQHIVLQNLYVLFSINGAITEVQVTLPRALTHPIPWQTLAFGLVAGNSLDDPFLLWVRSTRHPFLPKNTWNTDSSDHSTRFHCVMVHPRCLRAQRSRRHFWTLLT